ncbi:TadA family conjugal transfer-associated ATPase [Agrococcus carbonis]|uniref:Pilus assembly protein CpaF n=1 Tax=Agrococcus carbonis TaxID=684552 RepID=A0A1H1MF48_9MICO|nr:TadA family conjugal transfer-associated ATPase [Agrococcus carbonis]SDR85461.1 pilus assembly protein CpaF [Agrococcus carbonis]
MAGGAHAALGRSTGIPFVAGATRGHAAVGGAPARTRADGGALREFAELAPLVAEAAVTDVFVTAGQVWVDRGAGPERAPLRLDAGRARELAVALVAAGGRHVDEATPAVDVRLHDGIRVHAVLPPVAVAGAQLSIRLPRVAALSLDELDDAGAFDAVPLERVRALVERRANVLVAGAGGSGKTTLLGAMLSDAAPGERIVTIEDVAELRIRHPHVVALEARQANAEGAGAIGLEQLVREALRMRPDRLVLGECRGAEVRELLSALNTGHDGGAGTLHANSLDDVPARLEALGALAGLSPAALARQAVSAIDAVLHLERHAGPDGPVRRVAAIGELALSGDRLVVRTA